MIKSSKEYTWVCKNCGEIFRVRKDLQQHYKEHPEHRCDHKNKQKKEYCCKYCGKKWITTQEGHKNHETHCYSNPDRKLGCWTNKHHSEESKNKISNSMKQAHKEQRAWNIGKSRWNNKMSYPEEFFSRVIENEFIDKNYEHEYALGIYSLDFAWPHKQKCIEIDGDQHQRFQEIIERDKRKDQLIKEKNWKVLRIKWKDMFHDTKTWIKIAKDFIDD